MTVYNPLIIKVEAEAGCSLRRDAMPAIVNLAFLTKCTVELKANGVTFWAYPTDMVEHLQDAFDRLYGRSDYVSTRQPTPPGTSGLPIQALGTFDGEHRVQLPPAAVADPHGMMKKGL